jgi:LacI family transcriptional regulator
MTSIKEVAKEAGVSVATVSRIINNIPGAASGETSDKVRRAIQRLQYRPNAIARGLNHGKMNTLGVVFASDNDFLLTAQDYYIRILEGIISVSKTCHQKTLLFLVDSWRQAEQDVSSFVDGQCDGLILMTPTADAAFYQFLRQSNVPFVVTGGVTLPSEISSVAMDDEDAGYLATAHLLDLGHRHIAHLCGVETYTSAALRHRGWQRALAERGIALESNRAYPGLYDETSGYQRTLDILDQPRNMRPTALFCADDSIASGALRAFAERGVRVPEEMSLVGVNDAPHGERTTPPLTSIRQPYRRIGSLLAAQLLAEIEPNSSSGSHSTCPGELIIRASTAKPAR